VVIQVTAVQGRDAADVVEVAVSEDQVADATPSDVRVPERGPDSCVGGSGVDRYRAALR
jgi:hypothetical protein